MSDAAVAVQSWWRGAALRKALGGVHDDYLATVAELEGVGESFVAHCSCSPFCIVVFRSLHRKWHISTSAARTFPPDIPRASACLNRWLTIRKNPRRHLASTSTQQLRRLAGPHRAGRSTAHPIPQHPQHPQRQRFQTLSPRMRRRRQQRLQ